MSRRPSWLGPNSDKHGEDTFYCVSRCHVALLEHCDFFQKHLKKGCRHYFSTVRYPVRSKSNIHAKWIDSPFNKLHHMCMEKSPATH